MHRDALSDGNALRRIAHGDAAWRQACELRDRILRRPLGLCLANTDLAGEEDQIHCVALSDDRVVAVVIGAPDGTGGAQVRQMAVEPDRQGQGIGKRLLDFLEEELRSAGCHQAWMAARCSAADFYQRSGWQPVGPVYRHLGIDHQRMEKGLGPAPHS